MSIDVKAIIGDTSSSVLTPAEIMQLGLRRKALRQQQEQTELTRQTQTLSMIGNNIANIDTTAELNAAYDAVDGLDINPRDTTANAFQTIVMSQLNDTGSAMSERNVLANELKELDKLEYDKVFGTFDDKGEIKEEAMTYEDLFTLVNKMQSIQSKLGSDRYKRFITPELAEQLQEKGNHFATIGEALVTGDEITEQEWKVIMSGNKQAFIFARNAKVESSSAQVDIYKKRWDKLDGRIATLVGAGLSTGDDTMDFLSDAITTGAISQETAQALEGAIEKNQITAEELMKVYVKEMKMLEGEANKSRETYKAWSGEDLPIFSFRGEATEPEKPKVEEIVPDEVIDKTLEPPKVPLNTKNTKKVSSFISRAKKVGDISEEDVEGIETKLDDKIMKGVNTYSDFNDQVLAWKDGIPDKLPTKERIVSKINRSKEGARIKKRIRGVVYVLRSDGYYYKETTKEAEKLGAVSKAILEKRVQKDRTLIPEAQRIKPSVIGLEPRR